MFGKIHLPKVKHPKFEGHVMPNWDGYQNRSPKPKFLRHTPFPFKKLLKQEFQNF